MTPVTMARHAMATRFELVLHGESAPALRAAGEEALDEIERLENRLSLFRPGSEIAHLNQRAASEPVRVTPALFSLLQQARKLHQESGGAFDITIAPLVRCWGFLGGTGSLPKAEELAEARAKVGMHLVHLDPKDSTVHFARAGVMLDLGAIGKGYAIECAAGLLRDAGVTSALIHGGTSTVYAIGHPPEAEHWKVAVQSPIAKHPGSRRDEDNGGQPTGREAPLAIASLRDEAMSVSAVWGKFFEAEGKAYGHVIDPRTGEPASRAVLTAVVLPSATETDALSTALLTLGPAGHDQIGALRPGMRTLLASAAGDGFSVESRNWDSGVSVNHLRTGTALPGSETAT
jgi:thiamine biosynthesis lipoprotein